MISSRNTNLILRSILLGILLCIGLNLFSQQKGAARFGTHDTLSVPVIIYKGDTIPYGELELCWVTAPMSLAMRKRYQEWTRLRNAVYVTYPYAKKAGSVMNDINAQMINMHGKEHRKKYIKSRENELKKNLLNHLLICQFTRVRF